MKKPKFTPQIIGEWKAKQVNFDKLTGKKFNPNSLNANRFENMQLPKIHVPGHISLRKQTS